MSDLTRFNEFLSGIDVDALRDEYRHIKLVELDMPKPVQALKSTYEQYWDQRADWPEYGAFYEAYKESIYYRLEEWREHCGFSKETFYRGLPARIYRTWASLLTQVQGAYVAEDIYGKGKVEMGVDIDHSGKDIVIELGPGLRFPVQIKKLSERPEATRKRNPKHKFIEISYQVPSSGKYKKDGGVREPYKRWESEWGGKLERLDNGFVIFKRGMFEKDNLLRGLIE